LSVGVNIRKNVILIIGAVTLLILTLLALLQLSNQDLAKFLGLNKISLNINNDYSVSEVSPSITLNSDDLVSNNSSSTLNVAELTFNFDPTKVSMSSMTPHSNLISLGKTINNTTGVAKIDIAYPQTNFPSNIVLLTMQFTFIQAGSTTLTLNAASTYGAPNSLDYAASKKSFAITYPTTSTSSASSSQSSTTSSSSSAGAITPVPLYRFYRPSTMGHLYTVSIKERDKIINTLSSEYVFEGQRGFVFPKTITAPTADQVPVHRFFNMKSGTHKYTATQAVIDSLTAQPLAFKYEGIVFYAYKTTSAAEVTSELPFYEFFNSATGGYFYTSSEKEKNKVIANLPQLRYIGIPFLVLQ
jgi:hypothetical protein